MSGSRRRRGLKVRLGLLLLLLSGFGVAGAGPAREALEQQRAIRAEEQKLAALLSTNAGLERELARLNDQEYLEKAAREQLGLVRPGETAFIVETPPPSPAPKRRPPEPLPWYRKALDWLVLRLRQVWA